MDPCRDMRIFSRVSSASGISHQVSSQAAGAGSCKRLQLAKAYSYDFSLLLFGIPKQRAPVDHPTSGRPVSSPSGRRRLVDRGSWQLLYTPRCSTGACSSVSQWFYIVLYWKISRDVSLEFTPWIVASVEFVSEGETWRWC